MEIISNIYRTMELKYIFRSFLIFYRIFFQTSDLYSVFVWIAIMCSIVHMSVAIFQLDLVKQSSSFIVSFVHQNHLSLTFFTQAISTNHTQSLLDYIMCLLASLSNMFLFCYFGRRATDSFENMTDVLYHSKWTEFSPKFRKYFIIAIGNTQRPLYYHGFKIMKLDLESFTQV